ncbi:MAG: glycerate kinase, partial [Eubacteriales bacterium]|nr:glycerate kinase [Eubacteriales bacterium]
MQVKRFGLGIRFDLLEERGDDGYVKRLFEELFSVLTLNDVKGLSLYGGMDNTAAPDENIYLVVIMGAGLKTMRRVFQKIDDDAGIGMYLAHSRPYLENNRLSAIEGLTFYGTVQNNGAIAGGDADCFGLVVPRRHGKRRPVGKGIKILLAPDSFKGTISSTDAIKRLTFAARRHFPGCKIVPLPIADGGEGTVRALVTACDGAYRKAQVTGPMGEKTNAVYGVLRGKTAVIETAEASGLSLVPEGQRDLMAASSFGLGELLRRALDEGLRDVLLGLGGSATNDGGMGCARALGVKFFDENDRELMGCGADLIKVKKIDLEYLHPAVSEARFTLMCDVTNPLCGPEGATYVYGPQKGGAKEQLDLLEKGMAGFSKLLCEAAGRDVASIPGAGAAGGLGAMLMAILDPAVKQGIDAVLDAVDFERMLKGVALVVTGEGRLDAQSARY